jgi:hypothetical protein
MEYGKMCYTYIAILCVHRYETQYSANGQNHSVIDNKGTIYILSTSLAH